MQRFAANGIPIREPKRKLGRSIKPKPIPRLFEPISSRPKPGLVQVAVNCPSPTEVLGRLTVRSANSGAKSSYIRQYKKSHPCLDCKEPDPIVLVFHHRDQTTKLFTIGNAVGDNTITWEAFIAEIAKCDVVCANCHLRRHQGRRSVKLRD